MRHDKPYGDVPCTAITDTAGANSSTPANLALCVTAKHTQNTDTGTTSAAFQLDNDATGPKLKNVTGALAVRNEADDADAAVTCSSMTASGEVIGPRAKWTTEGGLAVSLKNNTGHASVKGEIVIASASVADAVDLAGVSSVVPIGVIYNASVAEQGYVWVVVSGIAQVLLKNETGTTMGQWLGCSDTAGRAFADADPIASGKHNQEIGHCIETVAAGAEGVAQLCRAVLHQN